MAEQSTTSSSLYNRFFQPFSTGATKLLPSKGVGFRTKSKRADRIPDQSAQPLVNEYHSINDPAMTLRVPKKVLTPVKVEAKVWLANERTFISYISTGLLLSSIASGLLLGAKDSAARWFALVYAIISAGILVFGWVTFQTRLTRISARDAASFDVVWGPMVICVALFVAILVNFIVRVQEAKKVSGVSVLSPAQVWAYQSS